MSPATLQPDSETEAPPLELDAPGAPPAVAPAAPAVLEQEAPIAHPAAAAAARTLKSRVIPPAVLASRMQRYSIWLMLLSLGLIGANFSSLKVGAVLWFAAGLTAAFALLCAITVVILNAIAWNFARLSEELRGGRTAQHMQ